jgi:dTDP-4-dehydrorhamnose reductase
MKKILVTGANGQLGKTIEEFYSVNDLNLDFTFVTKNELDITSKKTLKSFFKANHFDYCINCAAYTNVEQAEKTPEIAFKVNAEAVKYLAEACLETETTLIHISTDYVFDGEKQSPYTIDDLPNPINEYGKSKLQGEKYIQDILENYFIIRTSWLYSKKYGRNFYKTILDKAKTEIELFITTEQVGCPTDTVSLSNYIVQIIILNNNNFGVYHFSDNLVMSWYDFALQIILENKMFERIKLSKAQNYINFAKRPKYSVLKNT